MQSKYKINLNDATQKEIENRINFVKLFKDTPIPDEELLTHLPLYLRRQDISHLLFMNHLYQKVIDVNGIIVEFGVRWGRNLALFESFRGIYEPYNYTRKIIGFDTFEGFPSIHEKDGENTVLVKNSYSVSSNYENYLEKVLDFHESLSPISHIKKYELIKGDANITLEQYLENHPETIIALAYFDFDIYEPTKKCLETIKGHLTKGSIIGFDELNCPSFPGETAALKEVLGLSTYKIKRTPLSPYASYLIYE